VTKADFDSAISMFESRRPSQPQWCHLGDVLRAAKRRHFRGLAAKSLVSVEEFSAPRTEGRGSRDESLLDEFSISEIWARERPDRMSFPEEADSPSMSRRGLPGLAGQSLKQGG
jgi:hypothetical protein